jgi:hypothetical protein
VRRCAPRRTAIAVALAPALAGALVVAGHVEKGYVARLTRQYTP